MRFDQASVSYLAERAYVVKVRSAFGEDGSAALTRLLDAVKLLYAQIAPEGIRTSLTVMCRIDQEGQGTAKFDSIDAGFDLVQIAERLSITSSHVLVTVESGGRYGFAESREAPDLKAIADGAVVYHFSDCDDRILAGTHDEVVRKVSPVQCSMFAKPTLSGLEDALRRYASTARETRCRILDKVWIGGGDGPRLVLANKPESIMRDSLEQALSTMLEGDANVRPEQNTDERKPVDLRIDWYGSRASALVEIKWLGRSLAKSRTESDEATYTEYTDARAREGATQLADYLDREKRRSSDTMTKGYLVVFDARRRNVGGPDEALVEEDAMFYAERDIVYEPRLDIERDDFAKPERYFMRPRQSNFRIAA